MGMIPPLECDNECFSSIRAGCSTTRFLRFEIRAGCSTERVFRSGRRANSRENNGLFWGQKGPKNVFFENRFFPYYLPVDLCVFRGEMWRSKAGPPKKGSLLTFLAFFSLLFARRFSPYYLPVVFEVFRGGEEKRGGDGSKRVKKGQKGSKRVKKGQKRAFRAKKGGFSLVLHIFWGFFKGGGSNFAFWAVLDPYHPGIRLLVDWTLWMRLYADKKNCCTDFFYFLRKKRRECTFPKYENEQRDLIWLDGQIVGKKCVFSDKRLGHFWVSEHV